MTGVIVTQQLEHIVFVNTIVTLFLLLFIFFVIPWPCLRRVGHPFDSCHLTLDHPGLRRTGTASERLRHFRGRHPLGKHPGNAATPSPNQDLLFNPWGFTTQALSQDASFVGAWSSAIVGRRGQTSMP
jgi:hypothetical protein